MEAATVTGPVPPDRLGRVLMHEHALALAPGAWLSAGRDDDRTELAVWALRGLREAGIDTIVDLASRAVPPARPESLRRISERTGVHIVMGAGFYKDGHLPPWVAAASVDELADWYLRAATEGIDGSGVRAGVFGELGSSGDRITAAEERNLRAAARAHHRTGVAISTHCTLGALGREQADLLGEEGVDLSRVVIGHQDLAGSLEAVEAVLQTGANVGFDTLGKESFDYAEPAGPSRTGRSEVGAPRDPEAPTDPEAPRLARSRKWGCHRPDADRLDLLVELIGRGYAGQIVLSTDLLGRELHANAGTHGAFGYHYVPAVVAPELRRRGVPAATIVQLLVHNPARILAR